MSYTKEINRKNPTCFLFAIDQSGSMDETMAGGSAKFEFVADVLNQTLAEAIVRCTKADGVRDYFDIGVIGCGGERVGSAFGGSLSGQNVNPISEIENNPLRIDERVQDVDTGEGVLDVQLGKIFGLIDAYHDGGTPMRESLATVGEIVANWYDEHPTSYPPTVVHVADGQSTDGDPKNVVDAIKGVSTNDGEALLFNLHVDNEAGDEILFPSSEDELPDEYSKMLFRMSSKFPELLVDAAQAMGYQVDGESRFFAYKTGMDFIGHFFEIGTRASQLR